MSWKFKPVSLLFKNFTAGLSVVTMCISPVAQGAAAKDQKKLINQYLKETGLTTKKMTVGEYWRMVRHVYPAKLQKQMDQWVALNRTQTMPAVEATSFKDADGKEQVRLTLSKDGQTITLSFTGNEESPLKINGVPFSKNELIDYKKFNLAAAKLVKQDKALRKTLSKGKQAPLGKKFVLTYNEYKKLTAIQKAEYFIRLRRAMEASQQVYKTFYGTQAYSELNKKYEWVLQFFFGEEAEAAKGKGMTSLLGKPCIVAGYLSKYGENGSCGGQNLGAADLKEKMSQSQASCSGNGVACNPMVYGFDAGGAAYCVSRSEVKYATKVCNSKSPLQNEDPKIEGQNKKRIIESYLKKVKGQDINLVLNEEGKISEEQYKQISGYLDDLQMYINSAVAECDQAPLRDIQKYREDQVSACDNIRTRAFSLQSFAMQPEPLAPAPLIATSTCNDKKSGSMTGKSTDDCICPEGTKDEGASCVPGAQECDQPGQTAKNGSCGCTYGMDEDGSCLLTNPAPSATEAEDDCGFWCRNKNWIIPVGLFAVAGGLMWWLLGKNKSEAKNDPVYVPPAPVPDPGTGTSVTPPPVQPPPPAPCPAPNTYVNGVCVPPVVVPPPANASEGGTKVDDPGKAGGVR